MLGWGGRKKKHEQERSGKWATESTRAKAEAGSQNIRPRGRGKARAPSATCTEIPPVTGTAPGAEQTCSRWGRPGHVSPPGFCSSSVSHTKPHLENSEIWGHLLGTSLHWKVGRWRSYPAAMFFRLRRMCFVWRKGNREHVLQSYCTSQSIYLEWYHYCIIFWQVGFFSPCLGFSSSQLDSRRQISFCKSPCFLSIQHNTLEVVGTW